MKSNYNIIVFFVSTFLLMSCTSKRCYFDNRNISIKSKIKENYLVVDNKFKKLDGMFCLLSKDDINKVKDNFSIEFIDEKLKCYNFIISLSEESSLTEDFFNAKIIDLNLNGIHKVEFKNSLANNTNYYIYEKKIKNGYIHFGNTSKSEIDLNFLLQKFSGIEIIEK